MEYQCDYFVIYLFIYLFISHVYLFIHLFRIAVAPQIAFHPQNATPTEGEMVTLFCNATGDPIPTISWRNGSSIISSSDDLRISFGAGNETLKIMNVTRADSGQYRCVANSSAGGDISSAATLNVQCKYSSF